MFSKVTEVNNQIVKKLSYHYVKNMVFVLINLCNKCNLFLIKTIIKHNILIKI
jgi:hypothetical protein